MLRRLCIPVARPHNLILTLRCDEVSRGLAGRLQIIVPLGVVSGRLSYLSFKGVGCEVIAQTVSDVASITICRTVGL